MRSFKHFFLVVSHIIRGREILDIVLRPSTFILLVDRGRCASLRAPLRSPVSRAADVAGRVVGHDIGLVKCPVVIAAWVTVAFSPWWTFIARCLRVAGAGS